MRLQNTGPANSEASPKELQTCKTGQELKHIHSQAPSKKMMLKNWEAGQFEGCEL
jgi:hypothetical protein